MVGSPQSDPQGVPFELQDAEGLLWMLATQSTDCVKLIDLDGRIRHWNKACEATYGWSVNEVLGSKLPQIPQELRLRSLADIRSVAAGTSIVEREVDSIRRDGSRIMLKLWVVPVKDSDGDPAGVLSVGTGVANDRRFEQHQDEFVSVLEQRLSEPLDDLVANALLLLRPEIGGDTVRRSLIVRSMARTAGEAANFLDTLAITSGLERGRLSTAMEPVDLAQLVTERAGRYPSGRVLVDFDTNLRPFHGDPRLLAHAIDALLGIADRVTTEGQNVSASVYSSSGNVVVQVVDRGPVIGVEDARAISLSPYAGSDVRGSHGGALALGVAIAVVKVHEGNFTVRPVTPTGARYTIEFDKSGLGKDVGAT